MAYDENIRIIAEELERVKNRPTGDKLPEVESTDEGKVLTVNSSGEWAAADPSSSYDLDYSTTEKDTGKKWIDGKTVYQKTYVSNNEIQISAGNQGNDITTLIDNKSNIEQIICCFATNESSNGYIPLIVDNGIDKFVVYTSVGNTFKTLTIQYTKTTTSKKKGAK